MPVFELVWIGIGNSIKKGVKKDTINIGSGAVKIAAPRKDHSALADILGMFLLTAGLVGFGLYSMIVLTSLLRSTRHLFEDYGGSVYGLMTGVVLVPSLALIVSGWSLRKYRPENNPWKGWYRVSSYFFLTLTVAVTALIVFAIVFWTVLVPSDSQEIDLPLWLFTIVSIPLTLPATGPWIAFLLVFLSWTGMLATRPVMERKRKERKEKEGKNFLPKVGGLERGYDNNDREKVGCFLFTNHSRK